MYNTSSYDMVNRCACGCVIAETDKTCYKPACRNKAGIKRLKSFEHGDVFITLDSDNGLYIVELDCNEQIVKWDTTTLDAACEMYHETCKATIHGYKLPIL